MQEKVAFINSRGQQLAGSWELPPGGAGPFPAVVFAHDADSTKDDPIDAAVATALRDGGVIALRFDFTGHGASQGLLEEATPEQQSDDLLWAIDYALLRAECNGVIGINGAGTGSLAGLMVALTDFRLSALVLRSPKADAVMQYASMISAPTLVIAGSADPRVEPCRELYDALKVQKRLAVVTGTDSRFQDPADRDKMLKETIDWFVQHLVPVEISV